MSSSSKGSCDLMMSSELSKKYRNWEQYKKQEKELLLKLAVGSSSSQRKKLSARFSSSQRKKLSARFSSSQRKKLSARFSSSQRIEYNAAVKALSYKQLLRISSAVNATSDNEKMASKLFYHTLTPPEMRIVKAIQLETDAKQRQDKVKVLQLCLQTKNKAELDDADVKIDDLLEDAKKDPPL